MMGDEKMKRTTFGPLLHALAWRLGIRKQETRCHTCQEGPECPGYDTGVIYPCPYYRKEKSHGKEK